MFKPNCYLFVFLYLIHCYSSDFNSPNTQSIQILNKEYMNE